MYEYSLPDVCSDNSCGSMNAVRDTCTSAAYDR